MAALVADSRRAGDAVIVQPPEAGVQLTYYLRDKPLPVWGLSAGTTPDSALPPVAGQAHLVGARLSLKVVFCVRRLNRHVVARDRRARQWNRVRRTSHPR